MRNTHWLFYWGLAAVGLVLISGAMAQALGSAAGRSQMGSIGTGITIVVSVAGGAS